MCCVLSDETRAISGKVFCPGTQARVTDRPGLERKTFGPSVRLDNHSATALHDFVVEVLSRDFTKAEVGV